MTKTNKRVLFAVLAGLLAMYGCDPEPMEDAGPDAGDPPETDAGPDAGPDETDAGPIDAGADAPTCADYCATAIGNCASGGANEIYADNAECMAICEGFGWAAGDPVTPGGPAAGNTIGCRTYHGGAPAVDDADLHCPHAGPTGADTCGDWCEVYCTAALAACTVGDAIYADMAECMTACTPLDDTGDIGAVAGDTVQCRLYHLGVAVSGGDTALHCPHAGADGGGVCVGDWDFRTEAFATYNQVDNMGMPAVATALVLTGDADKNSYNDHSPVVDEENANLVASLTVLHNALNDDLTGLSLVPCAVDGDPIMLGFQADVTPCLTQEVAAGVTVLDLVNPDTLTMDISSTGTFPNGRALADPVIDVTLAVLLLELGTGGQNATTFVDVPLNPTANDVAYLTEFPYLAPPHQPAP